jgi:hypothetical protein
MAVAAVVGWFLTSEAVANPAVKKTATARKRTSWSMYIVDGREFIVGPVLNNEPLFAAGPRHSRDPKQQHLTTECYLSGLRSSIGFVCREFIGGMAIITLLLDRMVPICQKSSQQLPGSRLGDTGFVEV